MLRITINNITVTRESALKDALEVNDQTGLDVEVCDILGEPIVYITTEGRVITY